MTKDCRLRQCQFVTTPRSATAFEHILLGRKLRFSPYRLMRDPTESKDWIFGAAFFPDNFDGRDDEAGAFAEAHQAVNGIKSETKLLSLTIDSSDHKSDDVREHSWGCGRPAQMWELYGQNHRGACMVFDREELHHELKGSLRDAGAGALYHGPVRYTPTGLSRCSCLIPP